MIFEELSVVGAFRICPERHVDERGHFARTWSADEFIAHGLNPAIAQCSLSYNSKKGTLRGMHFQHGPHEECKLVRCTRGSVFDVVVDLRKESPSYMKWASVSLSAENSEMIYIPEGCAHGFLTLEDGSEVFYQISHAYQPASAGGVRWDDPAFGIVWPGEVVVINDRDAHYPDYQGGA